MKKYLLFLLAWLFPDICVLSQNITVTVDPSVKRQTITGMGAQFHETQKDDLIYDIGISFGRLFAGGGTGWWNEASNDNDNPYLLDLTKITPVNAARVAAIKEASDKGVKFFLTIGSPPYWLKDTTQKMYWQLTSNPFDKEKYRYNHLDAGGILKTDTTSLAEFGEFALGVVQKFKEQIGADLYAISPQNEPEFAEPYFSCVYDGPSMVNATKAIGKRVGTTTKILFAEQTANNMTGVRQWATLANNDSECKNYIDIFAIHAYGADPFGGGMGTPAGWSQLYTEANRVSPVKEVWQTEGGPGYSNTKTSLELSIGGASEFFKAMYYGNCNMFSVYDFNKIEPVRYYSIKNMIRYIRPGSYRVKTQSSDTLSIEPLVFKHDAFQSTTIYVVNKSASQKSVKINGLTGKYDAFITSATQNCEWIGQLDLANNISFPAFSVMTLVNCPLNKIPNIDPVDTIVILKNSLTKITYLTGINDGGDGSQNISIKAWNVENGPNILASITTSYTSPDATGSLNILPKTDMTGASIIYLSVRDNSTAMNSMFNEKVIAIPVYVVPYINRAPTVEDITDKVYAKNQIGITQLLTLLNVTDGNDNKQKLSMTATSSAPWIVSATTMGWTNINLTPKAEGTVTITVTIKDDGNTVGGGANSITKQFKVIVGSGINVLGESSAITNAVYPNPAHDRIMISNNLLQYTGFIISDMQGKVVLQGVLTNEITEISTISLPPGMYIVKLVGPYILDSSRLIIK